MKSLIQRKGRKKDMLVNHEDTVTKINTRLISLRYELQAWQKVTFNTKKDGTPFQHLKKCFNNADYGFSPYDDRHERPRLKVSWDGYNGWEYSEINCYHYEYGKPIESMTFEEIKAEIEKQIANVKKGIQHCEDALKVVQNDLKAIDDEISKLREIMSKYYHTEEMTYYYALDDYLTANVKYLH